MAITGDGVLAKNWKSIFWSVVVSMTVIMEGVCLATQNALYANPTFRHRFSGDSQDEIDGKWQSIMGFASTGGQIVGLLTVGAMLDSIGYRLTSLMFLLWIVGCTFALVFAKSLVTILIGQLLGAVAWGAFQTLGPTFASDVATDAIRPFITSYANLCWIIGQLIGSGVLRLLLLFNEGNDWAWRLPYALQWVWPAFLAPAILLCPESPTWLVKKDRIADAQDAHARLFSGTREETVLAVREIEERVCTHRRNNEIKNSYFDCFRKTNLRRTELSCVVWIVQNTCGSSLVGFSTYFFSNAGLPTDQAFNMTIAVYAMGFVGTLLSWALMKRYRHRPVYLFSLATLIVVLIVIGAFGVWSEKTNFSQASQWSIAILLVLFNCIYNCGVGPLTYYFVSEFPSFIVKAKTVALARLSYNVVGLVVNCITPLQINKNELGWGGKAGFFWAGVGALGLVYVVLRLPEPRKEEEMDFLFENKVPAWRWDKYDLESIRRRSLSVSRGDKEDEVQVV